MRRVGVHGAGFTPITQMAPCPAGAVAAGGAVSYLLRATFDADDVGFANAQVLDSEPEMGANFAGQLTVMEIAGTVAIVSDECSFSGGGAWDTIGLYSQGIARAFGYGFLFTFADTIAGRYMAMFCSDSNVGTYPPSNGYGARRHAIGNIFAFDLYVGGVNQLQHSLFAWANATDYKVAMVLGGYSAAGVPWRTGEVKANYLYGTAMYVQGGAWGGDWHLLTRCRELNTATVYVGLNSYNATGTADDMRVPDLDLSSAYVINNYSTFDAANDTSLDAIAPEIGGTWTEDDGNWDIQGNNARLATAGGAGQQNGATVDTGLADAVIEVTAQAEGGGNFGIRARYDAAGPTFWAIIASCGSNTITIYEYNGGFTGRGAVGYAVAATAWHSLLVSLDGQRIDCCIGDGAAISYASAALNVGETKHGVHGLIINTTLFDDFVVYPKTHATYDTVLDGV